MQDWLYGFFSDDLAIDLGTANTLVYVKNKGIVASEPSVVVLRLDRNGVNRVIAVGKQAKEMSEKTPPNINVIWPLKGGVIADFDGCEAMLKYFIQKAHNNRSLVRPRVVVGVPYNITEVEKKAVRESTAQAGAREVYLIEEPMAAAIGAGLPVTEPTGNMIVDIGGGTTEVAVISLAGIVYGQSVRSAGDDMEEAIISHIRRKHNLLIGRQTAEVIKVTVGNAYPTDEIEVMEVKGQELVARLPRQIEINSDEIRESMQGPLREIVNTVRQTLERTPPELAADIVDKGILLAGGGALLKNIDVLLREEIGVPVMVAEDPLACVVMGCGKSLDNIDLLREVSLAE